MKNLPNDWSKNQNVVQATEVEKHQKNEGGKAVKKEWTPIMTVYGVV